MSRQNNNLNRKLRSALRRCRTSMPTSPAQKLAAIANFYAKVNDGYVVAACHQRPAPCVAQSHRDEAVRKQEAEALARVEKQEAVSEREVLSRDADRKRAEMITRPQETMRPGGSMRRVMIGAALLGMMAVPPPARQS
jgi:hypothetical protein